MSLVYVPHDWEPWGCIDLPHLHSPEAAGSRTDSHPTDCPDAAFWERSLRPQQLLPDSVQDLGVRASSKVNSNGARSRFYMILDALHLPSHDHSGTGVLPQRTAQSSAGFHAAHDAVCREQEPRLLWSKFSSTAAYSAQDSRQCCCGPPQQDAPAPSPIIREPKLWPVRIVARTGK